MAEKQVTIKDTKATILDAYNQLLETLQEKGQSSMNVQQVKTSKVKSEAISMADQALKDSNIQILMDQVAKFQELVRIELEKYVKIKEAIEAKNEELSELFDIEKTAFSLAALVDSNKLIRENMEKEMAERRETLQKQIQTLQEEISKRKIEEQERSKRAEEEYNYSFERVKKKNMDELNDKLEAQKKEVKRILGEDYERLTIREKAIQEREADMAEREEELNSLKQKVEDFPNIIAEEVKRKVGKEKGMLESKFETEKRFMEAASNTASSISEAKITEMNKSIENLKATIVEQQNKLDAAYKEIKEMAVKTVEGAGNTKMFQEMKQMMSDKANSK